MKRHTPKLGIPGRAPTGTMFSTDCFKVQKNHISPFGTMVAYLGASALTTVVDNPVTAYRQLVQQYAVDLKGKVVDPAVARHEASGVFRKAPLSASLSGLAPRIVGVAFKRIPKFGILLGVTYATGAGEPGLLAATIASVASAPFINPIRMVEKQQRAYFKESGGAKPILEILRESAAKNYRPLFRGTLPLMGHSLASATTGLVGQPKLQKYIQQQLGDNTRLGQFGTGLIASAAVSPLYVIMTNPLSRLEVIMQTSSIKGNSVGLREALRVVARDTATYGMRGVFRGQGIGIIKAIISLTTFHQGRIFLTDHFKERNRRNGI